jgi:hypothetical protein
MKVRSFALCLCLIFIALAYPQSKSVHVGTYTRKDGVVVQAHDRSAPKAATKAATKTTAAKTATGVKRNAKGRIARSETAKRQFEASSPCPAPGVHKLGGACPGYIIDHINPLACGGTDAPSNMQWQTTAAAKEKDKWERAGCGK